MGESQQYDVIGELYERAKLIPVGLAEQATIDSALPPPTGRSMLDVGCGTGFYARKYKRAGADAVTGVDSSGEMVAYARRVEENDPLGISYEVHGAEALPKLGTFDVVTSIWLLGYAEGEAALDGMLATLVANLAPGGTFLALVPNPDLDWDGLDILPRYGLTARKTGPSAGRQGYAVHIDGEPPIDFEGFSWPPGVIEPALERAGLTDVRRHPAVAGNTGDGPDFWAPLLANPTFAVFTAVSKGE